MVPRNSARKILGLYEHELNRWLEVVLHRIGRVVDVGANDGYFTFGCAAAFRRLGKCGEIVAFEPDERHFKTLQESVNEPQDAVQITLIQKLVGREVRLGMTTLDTIRWKTGNPIDRSDTFVKIDVEGAELDVLAGAESWLNVGNCFLIEVHKEPFLDRITRLFADRGLTLERVDQRPLALIGREVRDEKNWWLVSQLGSES